MREITITNANVVLPDQMFKGSLSVHGNRIYDVSEGLLSQSGALDFEGDYLIPGLVELHTDNLERHIMPRPKSFWPVGSAVINHDREIAAAGITTVFDSLSVGHISSESRSESLLDDMSRQLDRIYSEGRLQVDHFLHWRCEVSCADLMDRVHRFADNSRTGLFSVMDHTPGQRQFVDLDAYRTYYQGKYGFTRDELEYYMDARRRDHEQYAADNRKQVVKLAREKNIPLASHDDAKPEHIEEAVDEGIVISEFPTTLEAATAGHNANLAILMGAPNVVRGKSHSGNISARELADRKMLDILSSDYVPFALLYGAVLLEENSESMSLPEAIATVTKNPADRVGLTDRGELVQGKKADFVRFRMHDAIPSILEVWRDGQRIA